MRASSRLRANRNYNTAGSVKRMGRVWNDANHSVIRHLHVTYDAPYLAGGGGGCIIEDV